MKTLVEFAAEYISNQADHKSMSLSEETQEGSKPRTPKQKKLARMYGDPNKITQGDVLKARGVVEDFDDEDCDEDVEQLNEWEWDPANIAGAALLGTAAYQVGKRVVGGIVNAAGDYVDNRRMQIQHQRYLDRVAARKAATAAAKQAKEAAKQARAAKKAGGAPGQAVAEQYAEYISNQADRGYLTEASQRVQRMVDSCNKKDKKDADPLKGHELEYDGEKVHVIHPKKGVVGSFKPYAGIDTEGLLYSARRTINPRRGDDDLMPGLGVQQFPRGMKLT